ncbi:Protein transport protein sec72 [Zancudomyces culisetae]|uniref:Protein transport protein sec72 n=1 Tax=Zancudomyces culisetae TaxID=1213189 RepID=A0A1R1PT86_ZANCU|nr:Protein transport protein sec72 [Zancudomyces culisetae]|eukprot:OMH84154.1 Protein transport protein sec72 [Zancudomyces culisetae]
MVQFTVATRAEHVSAMFEAVWAPVLAALSSPLQTSRDPRVIYECLVGMQCGVTLACRFRLPLERAAYVSSLSRFTVLGSHILGSGAGSGGSLGGSGSGSGSGSSLSGGISGDNLESSSASITNKQLEATRALLEVALLRPDVGNGLQDDWMPVLQCVSLLERLSLLENPVVNSAYGSAATSLGNSPNQSITGITTPNSNITYDESLNPQNHSYERNTIDNNGVGGIGNGGYNPDETPASRFDSPGVNSIDDANFFVSPNPNVASVFANTPNSEIVEARKSISAANLKTFVRQTYSYVLGLVVDRIFVTSVNLSGNGIVDFVKAISIVAMDEITLTKSSSLYSRKSVYDSNLDHIHTRSHYNPNSNSNSNLNTNTNPNSNLNTNTNTNTNLNPNLNSHLQHTAVSSHQGSTPPLHMLTRIVEIARYNMARIRFEWSHIWAVLGDLFDRAGSHPNTQVAIFTLDSLRQLSQDFLDLDLDEVLDFQFQKQFLRPFVTVLEHQCNLVVVTNGHMTQVGDLTVKDMVLRCLKQLVEAKHSKLRSGWKAVLLASKTAAYDSDLLISELGLDLVLLAAKHIHLHSHANTTSNTKNTSNNNPSNNVDSNFTELIQTLTDYGVQSLQPKLSLAAVDQLSLLFNRNPHFSILLSLHRIVKTSDDLEVRSSALDSIYLLAKSNHLFFFSDQSTTESTTTPTTTTTPKNNFILFLDTIAFDLFSSFNGNSSLHSEQVELYISTTLVKALRHLIDLFVHLLNEEKDKPSCAPIFLEKLLDLLSSCICFSRETSVNSGGETLCRIGAACLQDLVDKTKSLLDTSSQFLVVRTFTKVMDYSLPYLLFDVLSPNSPILSSADEKSVEGENNIPTAPSDKSQKELYHEITLSCVLHLQLINTIGDIFISPLFNCHQSFLSDNLSNSIPIQHTQQHSTSSLSSNLPKSIYGLSLPTYPSLPFTNDSYTFDNLLILLNALESSRQFSRRFNTNLRLRTMLVECGVMPQLPSLTRQESCSTMASLMLLIKLYNLYSGDSEKLSVIISRLAGMASDILDCYSYTFGHSSNSVNESEEKAGTDALSFDLSMYPENSFYSLCKPTQTKKAYNSNGAKLSISSENHVTDEQTDDETDDDNNSRTSTNNRNGVTKKSINSTAGAGTSSGGGGGGGGVFQGYSANLLNFLNNGQRTNYRYSVVALLTFFVSEISRHISVQKTNEKDNSENNKSSGSIGDDNDPFDLVVEHVMKPAYPSLVRLLNCHMHFAGDNVLLVHLQVFLGVFGEYCFSLACK